MNWAYLLAWNALAKSFSRFCGDRRGNIAIIFAFSISALFVGGGASIDLARAYIARQQLSQVAELTCQYSTRPSVISLANTTYDGSNGFSNYVTNVNTFASNALSSQHWTGTAPSAPSGTYFTATASTSTTDSTSTSTAPSNPTVELSAQVPTYFMQIIKISAIPVHAKIACLTASSAPQIVTSTGPSSSTNYVAQETFATSCGSVCYHPKRNRKR
jgi:Flp pilus assembly protein TadG